MNQADRRAVDTLTDAERMSARAADQIGTARLIDSHVHIWDPTVLEYSWLDGELDRPYLPAEYQAGAPATTGVIFVEAGPVGKADEVAWAESLGWPELLGVVAHAPLEQGRGVVTELAALREAGGTVGIRRLLQDEPLSFFENPGFARGLARARFSRAAVRCVHPTSPACCPYRAPCSGSGAAHCARSPRQAAGCNR